MLKLTIPKSEDFNERTSEFEIHPEVVVELEHSLVSLSKWESKWEKPFLGEDEKSDEQTLDYIKFMCLDENLPEEVFSRFTTPMFEKVRDYIQASMTATWFKEDKGRPSREVITSEIIYYWMIQNNVPVEFQYWHLNRLITLLKVCSHKNKPPEKMNPRDAAAKQRALNEARKAKYNTSG